MSVHHRVYAECRIGDAWVALGPFVKCKDGSLACEPVYSWGSGFGDVFDRLREHGRGGCPDDISDDVAKHVRDDPDGMGTVFSVDFDATIGKWALPGRPHKHRGYVLKETIDSFEVGECEDIEWWFDVREYEALSDNEKREYSWYEWDNSYDDYGHIVRIKEAVSFVLDALCDSYGCGWTWGELSDARGHVRLICERS